MKPEKRVPSRLPTALHQHLVDAARADLRSLNFEIIHFLEGAFGPAGGDNETL
jgi:hypothetical protein